MRKISHIVILLLAALCAPYMAAQTESQQKEINKIKLDPAYIFAESTMDNADEARETVCLTLSNFMNEYLEESGESRRVAAAELGAIKYISGKRGSANYVFGYIPVAVFAGGGTQTLASDNSAAPAIANNTPPVAASTPVQSSPSVSESTSANPATSSEIDDSDAIAFGASLLYDFFSELFFGDLFYDDDIEYYANDSDSRQIADMIEELLETPDSRKAAYLLNIYKTTGKIRGFGSIKTCRDAAGAYWLIINDKGAIIALLGPGADDNRYNYMSGETDHLGAYGGKYAVWFTPRVR